MDLHSTRSCAACVSQGFAQIATLGRRFGDKLIARYHLLRPSELNTVPPVYRNRDARLQDMTETLLSSNNNRSFSCSSGAADIVTDISNGDPISAIGSVTRTAFIVGTDVVGGLTGPALGNVAAKIVVKETGKEIAVTVATRGLQKVATTTLINGTGRTILSDIDKCRDHLRSDNSGDSSSSNTGSRSKPSNSNNGSSTNNSSGTNQHTKSADKSKSSATGSSGSEQPPDNNKNNKDNKGNKEDTEKPESHWDTFLKIFNASSLDDILIYGRPIFKGINEWQKKELKKLITDVNNKYKQFKLWDIIQITVALLSQVEPDQINVHNFVNVGKYVLAYLCQELTEMNEATRVFTQTFEASRAECARRITSENVNTPSSIINMFKMLSSVIRELNPTICPRFVNIIAAVYHYFKHKFIAHKNRLFTPDEYFSLAREGLDRLRSLPEYSVLIAAEKSISYQIYFKKFGRKLIIIIKLQINKWNLSSVHFDDDIVEDDEDIEDGDEWINGEPRG